VALGCVTEALADNDDPEGALKLLQDMQTNEQWTPLVNAVMYCSVLKGFSKQKRFDKMWAVYHEMLSLNLKFSIVTFNTLLDACSRNGEMTRIAGLLQEMVAQGIEPNVITYGIIMKGYSQENRVDDAFSVLTEMRETTKIKPDEVIFNTLLDGCARQGMYDRGISVLQEMEAAGIAPTNFTLSVLVKLCTRSKKVERAFEICRDLSSKYKFRLNVHVYGNLINTCIAVSKDLERALDVFEQMLEERVRPDARSYTLLLHAFVANGQANDAAGLLRAAVGLNNVHPRLSKYNAQRLRPHDKALPPALVTDILQGIAGSQCGDERLAVALSKELRGKVVLDQKLLYRLAQGALKR
jgi:pentatricopeptide repeat protein